MQNNPNPTNFTCQIMCLFGLGMAALALVSSPVNAASSATKGKTQSRSLSDLELYDSFPSSKRLKNDCHALIRPCIGRFSTLMRLFLPFGQSYPASTWSRFKL